MADPSRSLAAVLLVLTTVGCSTTPAPAPTPADADRSAIRQAVDAVNATAAGAVATQQAVLARLVDPTRAAEQAACAPATITIRIDPVLNRLTPLGPDAASGTADPTAASGSAETRGRRYRIPALLEVYTGPIRTGTDLAGLEINVVDGVAHPAPLCLR